MKTKEEIKDLIASKIAGQGNQVDSGGKLAEILNEIVDMAGQGAKPLILTGTLPTGENIINTCEAIGLTKDVIKDIPNGKYSSVITSDGGVYQIFATTPSSTNRIYITLLAATASGLNGVYYKVYLQAVGSRVDDVDGTAKTVAFDA